ncbi:MAG: prepilin-type N-terminal cleavage/methylation domain-containing protein [Phycisphaerales bacterium]
MGSWMIRTLWHLPRRTTNFSVREVHTLERAPQPRTIRCRRGLTLVELIVVVAIILILACLLLWALAKVRAAVESLGKPPEQKRPDPPPDPPKEPTKPPEIAK